MSLAKLHVFASHIAFISGCRPRLTVAVHLSQKLLKVLRKCPTLSHLIRLCIMKRQNMAPVSVGLRTVRRYCALICQKLQPTFANSLMLISTSGRVSLIQDIMNSPFISLRRVEADEKCAGTFLFCTKNNPVRGFFFVQKQLPLYFVLSC